MITFSSEAPGPSLLNIGIALAACALIVAVVVWNSRRRSRRTVALDAALTISVWWIVLAGVGAAFVIAKAFSVDSAELDGPTTVLLEWPEGLPCSEFGDSATMMLTCGAAPLSDFTVGNASTGLRLLAAAAQLSTLALGALPAVVLAVICFHTLRRRPFSRTVTRALIGAAIAVVVLGVLSDLLSGIAATAGLREALPPDSEWYPHTYQLTVTPLPFAAALGLLALAAVFRQGLRLEQERAALQRETEGLV